MTKRGISIVVPVYNSEMSLEMLVSRLGETLDKLSVDYEIILVNDQSRDKSWSVIERLVSSNGVVRGIDLMRNYGQHNALLAGIRDASYDTTVTIDDDLQHPPEEIPKLLERLTDEYDVVYGTPKSRRHGFFRDMASQMTKLALSTVMNIETARKVSAFRVFRTQLRDSFVDYRGPRPVIDVLLTWSTTRFNSVEVRHEARHSGESNYTFFKLVQHAMNMATGFSTLPLRVASILGFVFTMFGLLVLLYVVGIYFLSGTPVAGFPFLASIIALFSGVQLFALGIIGEYLARMHIRMMDRPSYIIRRQCQESTKD